MQFGRPTLNQSQESTTGRLMYMWLEPWLSEKAPAHADMSQALQMRQGQDNCLSWQALHCCVLRRPLATMLW